MTRILLTNDDGISASGIAALRRRLDGLGEIVTIAPDGNRSAIARSITIERSLRAERVTFGDGYEGIAIDGTPVDCVRAATLGYFCEAPDLVVSGVNLGPNMGEDVTYSGTVGAALEGALLGIPGVAVSIMSRRPRHLDEVTALAVPVIARVIASGLPPQIALNVNLPDLPAGRVTGLEVTRLGLASYHERLEVGDSDGRSHVYTVHSELRESPNDDGTDFAAVARGAVSVTALTTDWRDAAASALVAGWGLESAVPGGEEER
jgi:5'-nucleotidase